MIPSLTTDLNHVQGLDDEPNDVTGLTPALAKAAFDQAGNDIKTYINVSLVALLNSSTLGASGSESIASPTIAGITGNTVYSQIANLLSIAQAAQSGTILPNIITDLMLSNASGQVKDTLANNLFLDTRGIRRLV